MSPLAEFVAAWEEVRLEAYWDEIGRVWTIGAGRTKDVKPGDTCTYEQALEWLQEELLDTADRLDPYMTREPTEDQRNALTSLAYNCGVLAIGLSGLMARFNDYQDDECVRRFPMWNKSNGRTIRGLTRRREAEARIYKYGLYDGRP